MSETRFSVGDRVKMRAQQMPGEPTSGEVIGFDWTRVGVRWDGGRCTWHEQCELEHAQGAS